MSELLKLAERCEAAAGPCEELDGDIEDALGGAFWEALPPQYWTRRGFRPTGSLDAAMTLVPEGAHFGLGHDASGPMEGWAWVRVKVGSGWKELHSPVRMGFNFAGPYPQSPSLALCAAALRARDALTNSEGGGE